MYESYEQDEQNESPGMKQLRQARDKAVADLKAKDELLTKLQGQVRTQSVREILRDLGVKPKVADLIPANTDPTPEAIGKFVKDYEDVFGGALRQEEKPQGSEPEAAPATVPAPPSVDEKTANAFARLQSAESAAGVVPPDTEQAQLAALAAIEKAANGDLSKLKDILSGRTPI